MPFETGLRINTFLYGVEVKFGLKTSKCHRRLRALKLTISVQQLRQSYILFVHYISTTNALYFQGFGREKDENRADLCLRSIVFSVESGC